MEENINFFKGSEKIEEIEILTDEISKALEIDNLNFLLGSGCSSYVVDSIEKGISTMKGLANSFFAENPDFKILDKEPNIKLKENLELLMDTTISAQRLKDEGFSDSDYSSEIQNIKKFIFTKVFNGHNCDELKELYNKFYQTVTREDNSNAINIFTTNYDLYNEMTLDKLNYFYNNGFYGSYKRYFNPNIYNYTYVENLNLNKNFWQKIPRFFNLYKIHGSINWIKNDNEVIEQNIDLSKNIDDQYNDTLMIYPTPMKDRSTLLTPYSDLLRLMFNILTKPNSILITMGYSFSDEHINRIIYNSLSNPNFRLIVFGQSEEIERIKSMNDRRIWIINSDQNLHYFKNIVEKVLPPIKDTLLEEEKTKITLDTLISEIVEGNNNEQ